MPENKSPLVTREQLLEAGVHFGHQTRRWSPKMKPYIYTQRNGIHIIDLQKTIIKLEEAVKAAQTIAESGGKFLFVGTKKQAQPIIEEEALLSNSFYVNKRWLGGTLTNFVTIRKCVQKLINLEKQEKTNVIKLLPKKEQVLLLKEKAKLESLLTGIKDMRHLPAALFVVDPKIDEIAVKEANKLHIPVFGMVDSNTDPTGIDYLIPANDDAIKSIRLITGIIAKTIMKATGITPPKEEQPVSTVEAPTEGSVATPTASAPTASAPTTVTSSPTTISTDSNPTEASLTKEEK